MLFQLLLQGGWGMDNFKDSRVVHSPKIQRNFPRALLVDHLHDRWTAWVMEAKQDRCVYFFQEDEGCVYTLHIFTYKMSYMTIMLKEIKGILVFVQYILCLCLRYSIMYIYIYIIVQTQERARVFYPEPERKALELIREARVSDGNLRQPDSPSL